MDFFSCWLTGTVALSGTAFSEDGATLAYGVAKSGSDWKSIKFRKVDTVEDYPEELTNVKFSSMAWTHDHTGIFYGVRDSTTRVLFSLEVQFTYNLSERTGPLTDFLQFIEQFP